MTNIPDNSRFDRIETNLKCLVQLRETELQETVQLRKRVTALLQIVGVHKVNHDEASQGNFEESQRNIEASQRNIEASQRNIDRIIEQLQILDAEIKVLRTKSQRILEQRFGKQSD